MKSPVKHIIFPEEDVAITITVEGQIISIRRLGKTVDLTTDNEWPQIRDLIDTCLAKDAER